jgi:hypothetical protein
MRHRDRANEPQELRLQAELELSDREEREIIERLRPNAIVIREAIRIEGESELRRPVSALAWSGGHALDAVARLVSSLVVNE